MGRGILSGLFLGSVISVFILSVVSLVAPSQQRAALQPDTPAEEIAAAEPADTTAVSDGDEAVSSGSTDADAAMETADTDVTEDAAPETAAAETDTLDADPAPEQVAPEMPSPSMASGAGASQQEGTEVAVPTEPVAPADPTQQADSGADVAASETVGQDAGQAAAPRRPRTEVASSVSVPAGSEFRRPPPETEAALPAPDASLPGKDTPDVPLGEGSEIVFAMPDTDAAVRPETPGMAVTAPAAPGFGDPAPQVATEPPQEPGLRMAADPSSPGDPSAGDPAVPAGTQGLPPPVTARSVASEAVAQADMQSEILLPERAAQALEQAGSDVGTATSTQTAETLGAATSETVTANDQDKRDVLVAGIVAALGEIAAEERAALDTTAGETVTSEGQPETVGRSDSVAPESVGATEVAKLDDEVAERPAPVAAAETAVAAVAPDAETAAAVTKDAAVAIPAETDDSAPVSAETPPAARVSAETSTAGAVPAESGSVSSVVLATVPESPSDAESAASVAQASLEAEPAEGLDAVDPDQGGAVSDTEAAPATSGERLAQADVGDTAPAEPVDAERTPTTGADDAAEPSDGAVAAPSAEAVPVQETAEDLDRPDRKEVTVAGVGEAPPSVGDSAPSSPGVRVRPLTDRAGSGSRLPQIGADSSEDDGDEVALATDAPEAGQTPGGFGSGSAPRLDALSRNSVPFTNAEGKPLFSVILIDDGSRALDRQVLGTFPFPVTFAIDTTMPDAAEAAEFYKSSGFEVVALATGLPADAEVRDLEVTLEAGLTALPQAVAIMDPSDDGFGNRRALVEHVVRIAATDGHGLIGWDRGLGSVRSAADRVDHPAALVFRSLDDQGEAGPVVRRYLDRAAFKAVQEGSVIMAGRARPDTVTALFEWAASDKASQMALAPVSAVLRAP